MTLIEAFPLFLSFLVSFFLVKHNSISFGFLQLSVAVVSGCVLFAVYVGISILYSVLRMRHRKMKTENFRESPKR